MAYQSNISKVFRELRKQGIKAVQRAACCCSCVDESVRVFTTMQSDWREKEWLSNKILGYSTIYYEEALAPDVLLAAAKAGVAVEWDGDTSKAMIIRESLSEIK